MHVYSIGSAVGLHPVQCTYTLWKNREPVDADRKRLERSSFPNILWKKRDSVNATFNSTRIPSLRCLAVSLTHSLLLLRLVLFDFGCWRCWLITCCRCWCWFWGELWRKVGDRWQFGKTRQDLARAWQLLCCFLAIVCFCSQIKLVHSTIGSAVPFAVSTYLWATSQFSGTNLFLFEKCKVVDK